MRTKLLLTAAALAAGIATSMAQPVYSVNVVGYINVTAKPGYNLIANQLVNGNNSLNAVIPSAPIESLVLTYSGGAYTTDIFDGTDWLDAVTGDPSTTTVEPGKGFFFYNPDASDQNLTLVGEVKQGQTCVALPSGYALVSVVAPQSISLSAANSFPQTVEMLYLTFAANAYNTLINDGTSWLDAITGDPADAKPEVAQGFFIFNPEANASWCRTFNVQ